MVDRGAFLKRMMRVETKDVVHSSGYAKTQNSGIGVASSESFSARQMVDQNRKTVGRYRDSEIMNGSFGNGLRAKKYERDGDTMRSSLNTAKSSTNDAMKLSTNGVMRSSTNIVKPPARKNPGIFR